MLAANNNGPSCNPVICNDTEFKPGTPTDKLWLPARGGRIYRALSGYVGKTWQALSANIPGSSVSHRPGRCSRLTLEMVLTHSGTFGSGRSRRIWQVLQFIGAQHHLDAQKGSGYPNILALALANGQDNTPTGWVTCTAASQIMRRNYVGDVGIWKTTNGGSSCDVSIPRDTALPGKPNVICHLVITNPGHIRRKNGFSHLLLSCDGSYHLHR